VLVKWLSVLTCAIHWFNPIVWFVRREIDRACELSCDEAVIRTLDKDGKQNYGDTLIYVAADAKTPHAVLSTTMCEEKKALKERLGAIMKSKKHTRIAIVLSAVLIITACGTAVALGAGRAIQNEKQILLGANYHVNRILYDTSHNLSVENAPLFSVTADYNLYARYEENADWTYLGTLEPYSLINDEFDRYTAHNAGWVTPYNIDEVTDAYILRVADGMFYLAIQTEKGDTLLSYGFEDLSERGQGASDDTSIHWLYSIKSSFEKGQVNSNFFDRSLSEGTASNVRCFSFFENDVDIPGFLIVGFVADKSNERFDDMADMGFAVFQSYEGTKYKLIDYYVYNNAAIAGNSIYIAENPAIADANGKVTNQTAFDVILSRNDNLSLITRVFSDGQEIMASVDSTWAMTLFHWSDMENKNMTHQFFYDEKGNEIMSN